MLKVVWGGVFRRDIAVDEARSHWADVHGPLGLEAAGLVGYVQNHVVGAIAHHRVVDRPVFLDGYSVQWWESSDVFARAMVSAEWDAVRADGAAIFDYSGGRGANTSAVVQPRVIKDGPRLPFKVVWFARFLQHLDPEQASEHWLKIHGPIAAESDDVARYVQNLVSGGIGADGSITEDKVAYDGFSECWFADKSAYERTMASQSWARVGADAATLFDVEAMGNGMSAVVEEHVIRDHED